jgi:hypothetical protein
METLILLGALGGANLNHWNSEKAVTLLLGSLGKGNLKIDKPSDSEC